MGSTQPNHGATRRFKDTMPPPPPLPLPPAVRCHRSLLCCRDNRSAHRTCDRTRVYPAAMQQGVSYLDSLNGHSLRCFPAQKKTHTHKLGDRCGRWGRVSARRRKTRAVSWSSLQIPCVKSPSLERLRDLSNSSVCAESWIRRVGVVVKGDGERGGGSTSK